MNNKVSNGKSQMANLLVFFIFSVWKLIDVWSFFILEKIIPFAGFFPYNRELFDFGLPHVTSAFANFDGIHYLLIAHRGNYAQWEQAFFPFYPMLIKVVTFFSHNELISGLLIANLAFAAGLILSMKLFKKHPLANQYWWLTFLLVFPTSFFFGAVYTEGLFFLLLILTLYFLKKEKYWLVGLCAIFASLTRLIGVFLIIPIAFHLFDQYQKSKIAYKQYLLNIKNFLLLSPILGLSIYCFYLLKTTGDPLFFLTSQPVFGANRSTHLIFLPQVVWRYMKIFITAAHNFQFYVSIFEFLIFFLIFAVLILDLLKNFDLNKNSKIKIKNFDRLGLNLFSFANLILPTLTGTFSSIPRYVLFSLSFFLFLAEIRNKRLKIIIAILFFVVHILILGLFGQGYFIS